MSVIAVFSALQQLLVVVQFSGKKKRAGKSLEKANKKLKRVMVARKSVTHH